MRTIRAVGAWRHASTRGSHVGFTPSAVARGAMFGERTPEVVVVAPRRRTLATTAYPPHTKITLPALSPTMSEGGLAKWKKKEGDSVKPGDALCEIETDKATVDYEMQDEGYLAKILVKEGTTGLKVGSLIGILVEDKDAVGKFADFKAEPEPAGSKKASSSPPAKQPDVGAGVKQQQAPPVTTPAQPSQTPATPKASPNVRTLTSPPPPPPSSGTSGSRVFASPLAKTLAKQASIEINAVAAALKGPGSGPSGRIVADDVRWALASGSLSPTTAASGSMAPGDTEWMLNKLRAPHFYLNVDVDMSEVLRLRNELSTSSSGPNASPNDVIPVYAFILKASAMCMRAVPEANATWIDATSGEEGGQQQSESILYRNHLDVVILGSEEGKEGTGDLLLDDLQEMGLEEISRRMRSFTTSDFNTASTTGTFSVVNVGGYGVKSVVPIVRPGHSTALGVGVIREAILPTSTSSSSTNPTARVAPVVTMTLSCDHRVVDGAVGAKWIAALKTYLESPMKMLL